MLSIYLTYDVEEDSFSYNSNIKDSKLKNIIVEFISAFSSTEEEDLIERDKYNITITLDLSDDTFNIKHDCGSNSLMIGILGRFLQE